MDIGIMVEGQNGLTWERWAHILQVVEDLGFPSLFRSDHYFIGRQQDSLEPYLSFVVAAQTTRRVRFGPLVTPVTFRPPTMIARMAAQIDQLAGGRFVLGLGAGWYEAEHEAYGVPFPAVGERLSRLEEAVQVVRTLWGPGPASFEGKYYRVQDVDCLPKPANPHPPILIGGAGEQRTLRLVAQYGNEWNCVNLAPEVYSQKVDVLERHCVSVGRDPKTIRRSMMVFGLVGSNEQDVEEQCRRFFQDRSATVAELRQRAADQGMLVGSTQEVVDYLGQLAERGLQEIELQHLDFDSDADLQYFAEELRPRVSGL